MPSSVDFLPFWASIEGAGGHSFIGGAALFAMSGKSDEDNWCTPQFFQYLTSPELQVFFHQRSGNVPVTNATYEMAKAEGWYKANPVAEIGIRQLTLPGGEWAKSYRLWFLPAKPVR